MEDLIYNLIYYKCVQISENNIEINSNKIIQEPNLINHIATLIWYKIKDEKFNFIIGIDEIGKIYTAILSSFYNIKIRSFKKQS